MFFFSSRRRHTRYIGDWSSDVCSSDLISDSGVVNLISLTRAAEIGDIEAVKARIRAGVDPTAEENARSEERRVGKECKSRRSRDNQKEMGRSIWSFSNIGEVKKVRIRT